MAKIKKKINSKSVPNWYILFDHFRKGRYSLIYMNYNSYNGSLQYFRSTRIGNFDPVAYKSHDAYACCSDPAELLFGIMITWLQTVRKITLTHLQIVRTGSNEIFRTVNGHEDSIFLRNRKRESHLTSRQMRFRNKNYFTHSGYEIFKWDYHYWIRKISYPEWVR